MKTMTAKLVNGMLLLALCLVFALTPQIHAAEENLVWIATSGKGKKYHYEDCRTLTKGKRSLSVSEAKTQGYTACGVCEPVKL